MRRLRLVLFRNPDGIETEFLKKLEFKQIERALRDDDVLCMLISKE
jgi:hypothetical protein